MLLGDAVERHTHTHKQVGQVVFLVLVAPHIVIILVTHVVIILDPRELDYMFLHYMYCLLTFVVVYLLVSKVFYKQTLVATIL